ncbi:MAG: glutamyl-tRNA reductase [Bacteroidota bacterium]
MAESFRAISLSHLRAPVEIRELIYLREPTCKALLGKLKDLLDIKEAMVFSTCNRTEVYYTSEEDLSLEIIACICVENGILETEKFIQYFDTYHESEAIPYLFEVSMGLHSMVLGDLQIANQVKQAYSWAHESDMAGAFLHRVMHTVFHTNKRVQQETPFRDGAASVSYAAAELASSLGESYRDAKVLVVGLGEMGADVARNLDMEDFGCITLINRTQEKALELSEELGTQSLPISALPSAIASHNIIISSVSSDTPLITTEHFQESSLHSQFLIDLSVPRSVSRKVDSLQNVVVYDIDDIQNRTTAVIEKRQAAIPSVKHIISEEITSFSDWRRNLSISPTIHRIKDALEQIRKEELSKFMKEASAEESQLIDEVTRSMMNKILKLPVLQLKAACRRGDPEGLIDIINDLFNLESAELKSKKEK